MRTDIQQKRFEKKGWKFQFVCSTATQHLKYAPVIAKNGTRTLRGTSLSNTFKLIKDGKAT